MLSFLIAAFTCACVAFCYAEFASSIPVSGSVYTYAYMTVGEVVAFIVGWCLMLEYLLAVAAVAVGWSGYLQSLLQGFNIHLPAIIASARRRKRWSHRFTSCLYFTHHYGAFKFWYTRKRTH